MKWRDYVNASENILSSPQVPASLEIINLIKRVNPTSLALDEPDREWGYQIKNRLQSLLLEHYSDSFHLVPHPANPGIILIKHRVLPTVDACHADLASLSSEAIERVETAAPLVPVRESAKQKLKKGHRQPEEGLSPKELLRKGQALLDEYEYAGAEEVLAGLRVFGSGDLPIIARAAAILMYEIGAYPRCVETLLAQPRLVLKDRAIRELLAVAYHHGGSLPEARALFYELYPAELGLDALFAYADIAFKDGNLTAAWELTQIAAGKGFRSDLSSLQKEIQAAMAAQAEPLVQKAQACLRSGDLEEAKGFAREAVDSYPGCQEARALIAAIEAMDDEAQLAELWDKLEEETRGEQRLTLLTKLLERDKQRRETVKQLIAEEKQRQRQMLFDERLESLRNLVLQERWPECFDAVTVLMRQAEFRARAGEVLSLSPFFTVLNENKRLQGNSERSARDLWLRFVQVKQKLAAGSEAGCFETMEELKPWFGSSREFQTDYLPLLAREQERARTEIAALLEQCKTQGGSVHDARLIRSCLRKKLLVLPIEERRQLLRIIEEHLPESTSEPDPGQLLEEYREALQLGNRDKAAYLRKDIVDSAAREALEAEVAAAFHIGFEPLTLEISDDLPIDLTTPLPLAISFIAGHRVLFEDGGDAYVMIDFDAKAACRMTSPVFEQSAPADSTSEGSFLFVEEKGERECGALLWRATLSVERAAFTAHFDMRQQLEVEDDFAIQDIMMSSERETEYYLQTRQVEGRSPARVQRKRLAPRATLETLQMGTSTELKMWRWGSCPDHLIVQSDEHIWHVNRNLSLRTSLRTKSDIYKIDDENVYGLEDVLLNQRNRRLEHVKSYKNSFSLGMYEPGRVHSISCQAETALVVLGDDRQAFYHLGTNKFSQKIRVGRVIPSPRDGKWYSFDYSRKEGKLWLRDITREIHTELEWREIFQPWEKPKKREKLFRWFHNHYNFVYRPDEWGPASQQEVGQGQ